MYYIQEGDLKNPEELPQIEAPEFILLWSEGHCAGTKDNKTRIYCGERIIWEQSAGWEHWREFVRIAAILKARYGESIMDLIPTGQALANLGGDALGSPLTMDKARFWLFGSWNLNVSHRSSWAWDGMGARRVKDPNAPIERGSWDDLKSEESRKYIEGLTGYEIIPPDKSLIYGRPSLGKRFNERP